MGQPEPIYLPSPNQQGSMSLAQAIAQRMRYGSRGERYAHFEVGHTGQNICLQVTALGLATVAIGAFHDEQVSEVLRLDKQYNPLYIMPVGRPA